MSTPAGPAPLRFPSRETINSHLPAGQVREQALEVRALVDATEAAQDKVFQLGRPERDQQAISEDSAATSAALDAPEWVDPGRPGTDALVKARASAAAELAARQAISDPAVRRWGKAAGREVESLTEADRKALVATQAKITAALSKLQPLAADADAKAQRIAWFDWLAANGLAGPAPRRLAPERMPAPPETYATLLARLQALADRA